MNSGVKSVSHFGLRAKISQFHCMYNLGQVVTLSEGEQDHPKVDASWLPREADELPQIRVFSSLEKETQMSVLITCHST